MILLLSGLIKILLNPIKWILIRNIITQHSRIHWLTAQYLYTTFTFLFCLISQAVKCYTTILYMHVYRWRVWKGEMIRSVLGNSYSWVTIAFRGKVNTRIPKLLRKYMTPEEKEGKGIVWKLNLFTCFPAKLCSTTIVCFITLFNISDRSFLLSGEFHDTLKTNIF